MYTKHDLTLIDTHLRPHYEDPSTVLATHEQVCVVEALAAVTQRRATPSVVRALVTLARGRAVATTDDLLMAGLEAYVALAWRDTQHH